jgi:murein L,D-transpeptidase YcbB/YkuD
MKSDEFNLQITGRRFSVCFFTLLKLELKQSIAFMKMKMVLIVVVGLTFSSSMVNAAKLNEEIRSNIESLAREHTLIGGGKVFNISELQKAYSHNHYEPFWVKAKRVSEFVSQLEHCDLDGLQPSDYHLKRIKILLSSRNVHDRARLDILLSDAFMLYVSHIQTGKTDPVKIDPQWHVIPTEKNPLNFLYRVSGSSVKEIYAELVSMLPYYHGLKWQLQRYRKMEAGGGWKPIREGEMLTPGMRDARVAMVRRRLAVTGDCSGITDADSAFYDNTLKAAVENYQKRNGLEALGNIGPQTLAMMNVTVGARIKQILVNMERLRWLPQRFSPYYLLVNISDFSLSVFDNYKEEGTYPVIVGRSYRQTPVFHSTMRYLVFNPVWTIPATVLKNDIIPEVQKNPDYLNEKHITVYDAAGKEQATNQIDWNDEKVYQYIYRQAPGGDNSLGMVKFMFPNQYDVYLHDTPHRDLFQRSERTFSSGCIRVEHPLDLAAYLLRNQDDWTQDKIDQTVASGQTTKVILKQQPEVYLLYLTAWTDAQGNMQFRNDIYQRDSRVYQGLKTRPEDDE